MTARCWNSFVGEARELLQSSAAALLVLEKHRGDEAAINEVFRSVHTLKGSVGLFDFPALIKLVHAGEDVLSAIRAGELDLTSALVDMLLDALDQVSAWVDDIAGSGALAPGADGVSKAMTAGLRGVLPADYGPGSGRLDDRAYWQSGGGGMVGLAAGKRPAVGLHGRAHRR